MSLGTSPKLAALSIETALALFEIKIVPIIAYGLQLIWSNLSGRQLEELDKFKASYLKRILSTHRTSRNQLVYMISQTELLTERHERL